MIVYAPGCWDLLHVGHVRFLKKAAEYGKLIVGVASDEVICEDKGHLPIIPLAHRVEMLRSLMCVHDVYPYYALEFLHGLAFNDADVLAVGEPWGTEQRHKDAENWIKHRDGKIVRCPYTNEVSSSEIKRRIKEQA